MSQRHSQRTLRLTLSADHHNPMTHTVPLCSPKALAPRIASLIRAYATRRGLPPSFVDYETSAGRA